MIKIENEFIYKTLNEQTPSGNVYKVLKNGKKKHVGKLSKGIPYGDWSKLNNEGDVLVHPFFVAVWKSAPQMKRDLQRLGMGGC